MPQLVGLVMIGAGVYAGFMAIRHWSQRLMDDRRPMEDDRQDRTPVPSERDLGVLQLDPETGVYKPVPR